MKNSLLLFIWQFILWNVIVGQIILPSNSSIFVTEEAREKDVCKDLNGACEQAGMICVNDDSVQGRFRCECKQYYKKVNGKCVEKMGCEDLGGKEICQAKGDHWICNNDNTVPEKYICDCDNGYKMDGKMCIESTGCEEEGRKLCIRNGAHWVCKDDKNQPRKYRCECEEGYKEDFGACRENSGCKDLGGVNFCRSRGDHFICIDDKRLPEKYRCECEEGYKNSSGNCIEKTGCEDFGGTSHCPKYGLHWICRNDKSQQEKYRCECEEGYKNRLGICSETCRYDKDCLNGGVCIQEENSYFCSCRNGFKGDRCEINEACENLNKTCETKGAACIYSADSGKGYCECYSRRRTSRKLSICGDGCEINSCVNGVCVVIDGFMMCRCHDGFEGQHCDRTTGIRIYFPGYTIVTIFICAALLLLIAGTLYLMISSHRMKNKISLESTRVQEEITKSQRASSYTV